MTRFDYLLVLLGIIAGLALTEILSDVAKLCRAAEHVVFYWVPFIWAAVFFLLIVQWWWTLWSWRGDAHETLGRSYPAFLLSMVFPVFLYSACVLLFPDASGDSSIDMRDHFYREHSWLFGCCAIGMAALTLENSLSLGTSMFHPENLVRFIAIIVLAICAVTSNELFHAAAAILCGLLLVLFIVLFSKPMQPLENFEDKGQPPNKRNG
ncbi:MAG TPA: hypothetical protein VGM54_13255 [Chthoniobacter sp.]|jgi:hypothetical protein